jgi:ankyrin repeat protein
MGTAVVYDSPMAAKKFEILVLYPLLLCSVAPTQAQRDSEPQARPQVAQSTVISKGVRRVVPGEFGWTELMDAAATGDLGKVRDLLAKGADVNARDHSGRTALMSVANAAVAEALIAKGADVNAKTQGGQTALYYASTWDRIDVVQILLGAGADPNAKDTHGFQLLQMAALRGQVTIVRALLEKGADPNARDGSGMTALLHAAAHRYTAVVEALLDKGADPNAKDVYGQPPLFFAVENGDEVGVRALLRKGADPNAISGRTGIGGTDADTALKRAAAKGGTSVVRALLEGGADIDGKGGSGYTALMIAARAGQETVVRLLLEKGADIDARNEAGRSALSIAEGAGHTAIVQLLLAKAAVGATREKRKEAALLFYFQANGKECHLRNWNPANPTGNALPSSVLLSLSQCPDKVFFAKEADALVIVTGNMIQEISIKPAVSLKAAIRLPSTNTVLLAGYIPDGPLAAVFEKLGPADDAELSLFAFENRKWNPVTSKNCGRFFTIEDCLGFRVRGRSWSDWGEDGQVWNPKLALNPFVVSRGAAMRDGGRFILDKRNATEDEDEKTWGYIKFSVNNHQSVLYHASRLEQGDADEAMITSSIYLQTYKDRSPVAVVDYQVNTAIEHKYLLLNVYRDVRLIDLETGEQPVAGLKFAFWVR